MRAVKSFVFRNLSVPLLAALMGSCGAAWAGGFEGQVRGGDGDAIVGAMVTFRFAEPFQERTVFSGEDGSYLVNGLREVEITRANAADLGQVDQYDVLRVTGKGGRVREGKLRADVKALIDDF